MLIKFVVVVGNFLSVLSVLGFFMTYLKHKFNEISTATIAHYTEYGRTDSYDPEPHEVSLGQIWLRTRRKQIIIYHRGGRWVRDSNI